MQHIKLHLIFFSIIWSISIFASKYEIGIPKELLFHHVVPDVQLSVNFILNLRATDRECEAFVTSNVKFIKILLDYVTNKNSLYQKKINIKDTIDLICEKRNYWSERKGSSEVDLAGLIMILIPSYFTTIKILSHPLAATILLSKGQITRRTDIGIALMASVSTLFFSKIMDEISNFRTYRDNKKIIHQTTGYKNSQFFIKIFHNALFFKILHNKTKIYDDAINLSENYMTIHLPFENNIEFLRVASNEKSFSLLHNINMNLFEFDRDSKFIYPDDYRYVLDIYIPDQYSAKLFTESSVNFRNLARDILNIIKKTNKKTVIKLRSKESWKAFSQEQNLLVLYFLGIFLDSKINKNIDIVNEIDYNKQQHQIPCTLEYRLNYLSAEMPLIIKGLKKINYNQFQEKKDILVNNAIMMPNANQYKQAILDELNSLE